MQQADHGRHDTALLDELYLPLEDGRLVVVEPDNKSALHLKPGPLDALYVTNEVPVLILGLFALSQARLVRGFNADKDFIEPGLDHQVHQGFVVGQIDGGLGKEHASGLGLPPRDQGRQKVILHKLLVPDEIVVHEKDVPPPPQAVQAIEFGDNLRGGFHAHTVAKQGGDIAEVAIERAPARELDGHRGIALEIQQSPQGHGRFPEVCKLG